MLKRALFTLLTALAVLFLSCPAFAQGYWATYNYAYIPQQTTQGSTDYTQIVLSQSKIDTALHSFSGFASNMSGMTTGLMKYTSSSGALSTAVAGTDYQGVLTNPVTGTGVTYYIPYWTGTGTLGQLATTGTAGYYLVSGGASAPPSWQAAATNPVTVTKLTSGSGTYTLPTHCLWIEVEMVGGGGQGVGSGTSAMGSGSLGTNTTFGGNTAGRGNNGGTGQGGGTPATATLSTATGWYGLALPSTNGGSGGETSSSTSQPGGFGAGSPFGGGGGPGGCNGTSAGGDGIANTGGGGGGGGLNKTAGDGFSGDGGSAGAYIKAICTSPVSSYSYVVGVGGTGGSAGVSGAAGGNGGSGVIFIKEHYNW